MDLWTEFEGATIDRAYELTKLLQTEGRSAFFSTFNEEGESVLIRIIECHFDDDEILSRWRGVQSLGHPNFLRIHRFGRFEIKEEDTTAVYAVFERVDANLGEVLQRGRLSPADAAEIGFSVASALEALHASGFVHEHIEPGNIYAVDDTVKLRTDCIRETPEAQTGFDARQGDVHALANLLIQVLLGASGGYSSQQPLLPAPFSDVVTNCMNGSWGLAEIKAALAGSRDRSKASKRKDAPAKNGHTTAGLNGNVKTEPNGHSTPGLTISQGDPSVIMLSGPDLSAKPVPADKSVGPDLARSNSESPAQNSAVHSTFPPQKPAQMELPVIFGMSEQDFRKWAMVGVLALGAVLIVFIILHHWLGGGATVQPASTPSPVSNSDIAATPKTATSQIAPQTTQAHTQPGVQWRVVAYTYKSKDQAQKKASELAHEHPELTPEVFSPRNRAPWLVTIGGGLERDKAYELARRAHSLGLPRDTYAQNYKVQ